MPRLTALVLTLLITATGRATGPEDEGRGPRPAVSANVSAGDEKSEYAPFIEQNLEFFDFSFKTIDDKPFNLRDYAAGKPVVIVEYFAGWCANSNRNGHVVERLWTRYRTRGLGIVAVAEYSSSDELRVHINRIGIDYPVVIETRKRRDRKDSSHFKYRRAVGDKRRWGTPFYVIIEAGDIQPPGSDGPLARRVFTVSGELIESEAEQFLEQRLRQTAVK
ncbi:MAG TPA: TlpA disulfide reductase family protein [Blastocatellia bacterium]|nr:TlpA disulfide reductase family protein [Blastocatellia bacterium]